MTAAKKLRVLILPREKAEARIPDGANEVCVSIREPGAAPANLNGRFRDVLRLYFHDLAGFEREDGSYPDGAVQCDDAMADEIVAFVLKHRDADLLVVHCEAGISRSVAVGLAISIELSQYWAWPSYMPREYREQRYIHNRPVFEAVQRAIARATTSAEVQS
jgi:predicted protein tyrosine phosphatase